MAVPPSVHAPSVMTDRLSDQSGAALLLVSIRSEQTIPEPTVAFFFPLFRHFPPSIPSLPLKNFPASCFHPKLSILTCDWISDAP